MLVEPNEIFNLSVIRLVFNDKTINYFILYFDWVLTPSISIALVIGSDQEEIYIDANFSGEELLVFGHFILIHLSQEIVK